MTRFGHPESHHIVKARKFMAVAQAVASLSKENTKVGAVIVGRGWEIRSTGYNGLARGVEEHEQRRHGPDRYLYLCHAEENAIVQAARSGTPVDDCSIIVSGLPPCMTCARMIVQSGIKSVYYPPPPSEMKPRWEVEAALAQEIFAEAGVSRWLLT